MVLWFCFFSIPVSLHNVVPDKSAALPVFSRSVLGVLGRLMMAIN